TPGTFKDSITGQSYKEIKIVPLKIVAKSGASGHPGMSRVLYVKGAAFGTDPLCRSNDGITPSEGSVAPQSKFCKTCKHASWAKYAATKDKANLPPCKEKAKILFVERESGLP